MNLLDVIGNYPIKSIGGSTDVKILGIEHDSRKVRENYLFIAQKGFTVDGHNFINEAIYKGAIAVVAEEDFEAKDNLTKIIVENSTDALAFFCSKFYNISWDELKLIGITGTNGKTSTSYFMKNIFDSNGAKTGLIGTIGAIIDEKSTKLMNTTPDSLEIFKLLSIMKNEELKYCFMEVSSHALDLKRVNYMDFDIAIFTNLSVDHLDYHQNMENYFNSKLQLFSRKKKYNIINNDDIYGRRIIQITKGEVPYITYGINNMADVWAENIIYNNSELKFTLNCFGEREEIRLNNPCEFNIYNTLAAIACARAYNIDLNIIKKAVEQSPKVKGRFELLPINRDFNVIIDFAHTPDGLENILKALDKFVVGRKILVFGAGGNRDKSKRPELGRIASQYADKIIVTSDNPRLEDPEDIIRDIVKGIEGSNADYTTVVDRKEAIEFAISIARPGDTILLAGKGHEEYIILGNEKYPFNEKEIVFNIINNR